jgi:hypothetical protein
MKVDNCTAALLVSMTMALTMACGTNELSSPEPDAVEHSSDELSSTQGTSYQGTSYQGTSYQGTSYQGTSYQGTSYQGGSYGGTSLDAVSISGTQIVTKRYNPKSRQYERRWPEKICFYDSASVLISCTTVDLRSRGAVSPLVGTLLTGRFRVPGTKVLRSTSVRIDAVSIDPTQTMFSSNVSVSSGTATSNADVYLYQLTFLDENKTTDPVDDRWVNFCPNGVPATALSGVWGGGNGATYSASSTAFTMACTNGVISKCVRWGYKPWKRARRPFDGVWMSLLDHHQACTHAASANYCGTGKSFTTDGTLVDISDEDFVRSEEWESFGGQTVHADAFVYDGDFSSGGGACVENLRYVERRVEFDAECPGRFQYLGTSDDVACTWTILPYPEGPFVKVRNVTSCWHSASQPGKWLSKQCTGCTNYVCTRPGYGYCCDPTDSRGWNSACAAKSADLCTGISTPRHAEKVVGAALPRFSSGCTANLCGRAELAYCCNPADSRGWNVACTQAATSICGLGKPVNALR